MSAGAPATPRFRYLDGLRGIAALCVLFHHAFHGSEFKDPLTRLFGPQVEWFASICDRGVQIFFVLSGFVIAYSIRNLLVTPKVAGNFILRRQIRLDPAFWIALLLAYGNTLGSYLLNYYQLAVTKPTLRQLFSICFYDALGSDHLPQRPTFLSLFTSMFYANNIFHIPRPILGVSWTLCLEIQFYLILIAIVWFAQRFFAKSAVAFQIQCVTILALLSLGFRIVLDLPLFDGVIDKDGFPLFIGSWYFFAAGILIFWTLDRRMKPAILFLLTSLILAAGIFHPANGPERGPGIDHERPSLIIGALAIALIYFIGRYVIQRADAAPAPARFPRRAALALDGLLSTAPIQYLGKISYSLYLIHFIVLDRVYRMAMHFMGVSSGDEISPTSALLWFLVAIGASIAAAQILYLLVERPTMRLAASLKPKRLPDLPPTPPASPAGVPSATLAPAPWSPQEPVPEPAPPTAPLLKRSGSPTKAQ